MTDSAEFEEINEAKASMDHIYNQADPRSYFNELKKIDYAIPEIAKPVFQKLIDHMQDEDQETVQILDLGSSYGVNAALLKYDLSMNDLYDHWDANQLEGTKPEEVIERDQRYFAELDEPENIELIGLDQAENAIAYAEDVGLINSGFALNLETDPLPEPAEDVLAPVDMVVSTGCIGYVTEKTFDRLMPVVTRDRQPWIANFVLRMFPFDLIENTLTDWGYVTEKLSGETFVQREFVSAEEQEQVVEQLLDQGIDPTGKEADGKLLAEFYLSRPIHEAKANPIGALSLV